MSQTDASAATARCDGNGAYDQRVASTYDEDRKREPQWWSEDRFVAEYFRDKQVQRLLDVPVGTGRFLTHYTAVRDFTGVDVSRAMLAQAGQRLALLPQTAAKRLELGDVFSLRYADRGFDTVLVWRLLHLIPASRLPDAIAELCRVTGGELVVQTYATRLARPPQRMPWWRKGLNLLRELLPRLTPPNSAPEEVTPWSHIRAFYHEQSVVDELVRQRGFDVRESQAIDAYPHAEVRVTIYQRRVPATASAVEESQAGKAALDSDRTVPSL